MPENIQTITIYSRNDFRRWLKKHHKKENRVAVVVHKKHTGKPAPTHRELIEEAICFGWIDTTLKRLDEDTYVRNFTKRNNNSRWSDNTQKYAKDLIKLGKMTEQGMYFYKLGLAKPTHDHGISKNPRMPSELKAALAGDKTARQNFDSFPPSAKKTYYRWILRAKQSLTREKRVGQIVRSALERSKNLLKPNEKLNN